MSAIHKGPKMKRYSFLPVDIFMCSLKTDTYDSKTQNHHQVTIPLMLRIAVFNLNKHLAVERMWPMYCYDQTKLNYDMYVLEF